MDAITEVCEWQRPTLLISLGSCRQIRLAESGMSVHSTYSQSRVPLTVITAAGNNAFHTIYAAPFIRLESAIGVAVPLKEVGRDINVPSGWLWDVVCSLLHLFDRCGLSPGTAPC
jgi:hypothetical protein